jgi:hypothetical protein
MSRWAALPLLQPETPRLAGVLEWICKLNPEVMVTMAYGRILPPELLRAPSIACLNIHASLLPRYRGASPIQATIASGDREGGVTIMHMAEGLDTGDVILERRLSIRRRETSGSLSERLAELAPLALEQALELLKKLVDKFVRFRGEDHLDLSIVLNNIGSIYDTMADSILARKAYDGAISIRDRGDRNRNPHLGRCFNNLGAALFSACDFEGASGHLFEAHHILKCVLGDDHVDTVQCVSNLAAIDVIQGRLGLAVERLKCVLTVRERHLGPTHPQTWSTSVHLARALLANGDIQAAAPIMKDGLQYLVSNLGASHPTVQAVASEFGIQEIAVDSDVVKPFATPNQLIADLERYVDRLTRSAPDLSHGQTGADGTYRMQHEVVDILFSHELLMS